MVSIKSIQLCISVNLVLVGLATLQYKLLESVNYNFTLTLLSVYLKDYFILETLNYLVSGRPYIFYNHLPREQTFCIEDFVSTYGVEGISYIGALALAPPSSSLTYECLLFIPRCFLFELIFDFFHYSTHRLLHSNPVLYKYIHRLHHDNSCINAYNTFHHTLPDIILTNAVPIMVSAYIFPLPRFTLTLFFWFKTIVEVSGHTGKDTTSSFLPFIYLPRLLGIELYSRDHGLHHFNPNMNFSKRFSLWDKLFGTFKSGTTLRDLN